MIDPIRVEHIVRVRNTDGVLQIDRDPASGAIRIGGADEQSQLFFGKELILASTEPSSREFALAVAAAIHELALTLPE